MTTSLPSPARSGTSRTRARLAAAAGLVATAPVGLAASPFWAVASLTRGLSRWRVLGQPATPWPELLRYIPVVGWQSRPFLDTHARADQDFHLTTDAEGWRGAGRIEDAEIVVFGDSYAFGHGVDDSDMYTHHVDGATVKALGSDGYSMVHAVLWMEHLRDRLAGKCVVWMPYQGNDLHDNLRPNYGRYRMPYVRHRDGEWEIYVDHVSQRPWTLGESHAAYLPELAALCTPGHKSDRALDAASYLLWRARQACEEAGAKLIVLSVPRREQIDPEQRPHLRALSPDPEGFDAGRVDEHLARTCEALSIPFVALAEHLLPEDYQVRDIHWTARGNAKVGRLIGQLMRTI
jgi:hypothetical protein